MHKYLQSGMAMTETLRFSRSEFESVLCVTYIQHAMLGKCVMCVCIFRCVKHVGNTVLRTSDRLLVVTDSATTGTVI